MNRETGQRDDRNRRTVPSDSAVGSGARPRTGGKRVRTRSGCSFSRWWYFNWRHHRGGMICLTVLTVVAVLAVGIGIFWSQWAVAPDIPDFSAGSEDVDGSNLPDNSGTNKDSPTKEDQPKKEQFDDIPITEIDAEIPDYVSNQKEGVYTFLVIGRTNMDDNADMLMLVIRFQYR